MSSSHSTFASKTVFDALTVEAGEDVEEEELLTDSVETTASSQPDTPTKPSKSAIKKAQMLARTERRQRDKAAARQAKLSSVAVHPPAEPPLQLESVQAKILKPVESEPLIEQPKMTSVESSPSPAANGNEKAAKLNGKAHEVPLPPPRAVVDKEKLTTPIPGPVDKADKPPARIQAAKQNMSGKATETANFPVATVSTPQNPSLQEAEKIKKRQSFTTRTLWTFIMIGGFIGLLLLGHAYMILLVILCQTLVYREVTALFSLKSATPESRDAERLNDKDPWSKTLNWYFFAVTNYFLYGESIIYYFKHVVFADAQLLPFATNHRMISFTLYTIGFMGFVMSLKKGYLKQQFGLFCWVHMSLLLIVVSSHFIVNNILEGLVWFWVPASLVICNDVFAYIWGITLGRTPLIKLSPKKTVEGFVGAFWCTIIFGILWGSYFMRFNYMICPVHDLGVNAWSSMQCRPNPIFLWREVELWKPLAAVCSNLLGHPVTTISYAPYQLHLLFMSCFASLVAPFGGFFASGFKRAFNIKDFGHSIPGHGGMTDRMDCQFLMGVFTYVYYSNLIREHHVTVGSILQTIVSGLTVGEQLELLADLKRYLQGQGVAIP
ncbi:hypothetical protein AX17_004553 [Amanita inopinata Kibby_2008]|nr:hypothetical protein AX17_004553 [Amanita inopinata Kibby_2008]